MRLRILLAAIAVAALPLFFSGCASKNQTQSIERRAKVSEATNKDLFVIVSQPIEDTDDPRDPALGTKLPIGKYYLEAEDDSFWYFRSVKPIVLSTYDLDGSESNRMRIYGGIALAKTGNNAQPQPCVYVDDQNKSGKIQIWLLSKEFLKIRGVKWHLSTDPAK